MATKKYDLVVKIGEYTINGTTKSRWETIGAVMDDGKGGEYMFLKRTFNPAGVPFKDGSESIMVSMFTPQDRQSTPTPAPSPAQEDEIPY